MATTPYPFVANAVLTASQLNSTYNIPVSTKTASYVLVAADGGTRVAMNSASATTITVNTSLFSAGDSVWLQNIGAGVCTITAGTATVTTSGSLALAANAGGTLYFTSASAAIFFASGVTATAAGLIFINGASFSAANTVSLATSSFTSTYQNYLLQVTLSAASAAGTMSMRYRASGTDYTGSTYNTGALLIDTAGTIASDGQSGASQSSHKIGYYGGSDYLMAQITLFNPQEAANSRFTSNSSGVNSTATAVATSFSGGIVYQTTQYDAVTLLASGATTLTGNYRLYGYLKS